jgi:hypothetical protein
VNQSPRSENQHTEGGTTIIQFGRCRLRKRIVLASILARFEEGFASADLMTAKALLDESPRPLNGSKSYVKVRLAS